MQVRNTFSRGTHEHTDAPLPGVHAVTQTRVNIKSAAVANVFRPVPEIVEEELTIVLHGNDQIPCAGFANPDVLSRLANRTRQRLRPQDPTTVEFDLNLDFIPDNFFRYDVKLKSQRHLIFASDNAVSTLPHVKTLYMDATFKVVGKPFVQLFSLHSFLEGSNRNVKQVPLVFILMSRRRSKDYRAVLKAVRSFADINCVLYLISSRLCGERYGKCFPTLNIAVATFIGHNVYCVICVVR